MATTRFMVLSLLCLSFLVLAAHSASVLEMPGRHGPGGGGHSNCPSCKTLYPPDGDEPAPKPGLDFYFLVRQWPNEFCQAHDGGCYIRPDIRNGFTLHGLWPNLDNDCPRDFPEHCVPAGGHFDKFKYDGLPQDVLNDLDDSWISYTSGQECFLKHEWGCHGTCSGLSQAEYFRKTLKLHRDHNLLDAMTRDGLEPEGSVSKARLLDAFERAFGVRPILQCSQNDRSLLSEVWMCVTKDASEVVPCSSVCEHCDPNPTCDDTITFADDNFRMANAPGACHLDTCDPHSGTCKGSHHHHG